MPINTQELNSYWYKEGIFVNTGSNSTTTLQLNTYNWKGGLWIVYNPSSTPPVISSPQSSDLFLKRSIWYRYINFYD